MRLFLNLIITFRDFLASLCSKINKFTRINKDMWTNDRLNILEDYLSSNQQRLLIVYIDQHTSSLQLLHSIPSIANSINITHGLYYFIRKNDSPDRITSIDEFLKHIRFGYINGKSISCLTALVSTLFGPLFMDNTTVQDSMSIHLSHDI